MAATYQFGAVGQTGLAESSFGLLQTYAANDSADHAVGMNAVGEPAVEHFHNKATGLEADFVYDTSITKPVVGESIAVGGSDKYSIMSTGESQANDGYTTLKITLNRFTVNGIPANA
jgi:hypothetical protein